MANQSKLERTSLNETPLQSEMVPKDKKDGDYIKFSLLPFYMPHVNKASGWYMTTGLDRSFPN